ncbi:hypothetical protein NQ318_016425 [Aromia moschata]|uniref:Uncharacterized protein n=1 Tax=Aromia moschata TaxID=1265417 RepID=A0AAV8Z3T3_9CUCU|nr:hypothetical protein NQ318_016425 [Aromia moschata]
MKLIPIGIPLAKAYTVTLDMFVIFLNLVDLQNQKKINLMFCWQYRKIITQHLTNWLLISIWQRPQFTKL